LCGASQKGADKIRLFELSGKEFFFNYDKMKSTEVKKEKTRAKAMHIAGRAYNTGHGGARQHQKTNSGVVDCSEGVRRKGQMSRTTDILILLAFITGNSSFEPLLEGLLAQIHIDLS